MIKLFGAHPNLKIINSSANIQNEIKENGEVNPHIWTSIINYMSQVEKITNELSIFNLENGEIYQANCANYMKSLQDLNLRYNTELQALNGEKVICLNEAFSYLAHDIGLDTILVETDHEESTLSAETLKNLIQEMKENNIQIILVDKEDNLKNAQTLALETGAKIIKLNSGMNGDLDKNSYLNAMTENLTILKEIK